MSSYGAAAGSRDGAGEGQNRGAGEPRLAAAPRSTAAGLVQRRSGHRFSRRLTTPRKKAVTSPVSVSGRARKLMRWFDGGVEVPKGMRAIGVSGLLLAILALAALETWIEYIIRDGDGRDISARWSWSGAIAGSSST